MTYDFANKLTSINPAGTANDATFTFDALGRTRTRTIDPTGATPSTDTYSYAGASEVVAQISTATGGAPTITDSIVDPAGGRLGVKVGGTGGTVNWFLPDLHGNVAGSLTFDELTVTNAIRYDAYGETLATGAASSAPGPVGEKAWKYQGRLDVSPPEIGTPLYDMSARFYAPGIGAFTQLDTYAGSAQNPLSMNRFLYAEANPATLIDPSGHGVDSGIGNCMPSCPPGAKDEPSHTQVTQVSWPATGDIKVTKTTVSTSAVSEQSVVGANWRDDYWNDPEYRWQQLIADSCQAAFDRACQFDDEMGVALNLSPECRIDRSSRSCMWGGGIDPFCRLYECARASASIGALIDPTGLGQLLIDVGDCQRGNAAACDMAKGSAVLAIIPAVGKGSSLLRGAGRAASTIGNGAADITRIAERSITYSGDHGLGGGPVAVIGRQSDTAVAQNWPGHEVLNLPDAEWTVAKNDAWVRKIISNRQHVYVATTPTWSDIWSAKRGALRPFGRELQQLTDAGYRWDGFYLRPPD